MIDGMKIGESGVGGFNGHSGGGHGGGRHSQDQDSIERTGRRTSALMRSFKGSTAMLEVLEFMAARGVHPLQRLADQVGGVEGRQP